MVDLPLPDLAFTQKHFPLLHSGRLKDQDVLVHSLGCSVWNTFGHLNGYMAVVECPAPGRHGADIRSDSGWYLPGEDRPLCLVEFERFVGGAKGQSKLEEKLKNLLEAAQRWDYSPKILILSSWSQGVVGAPRSEDFQRVCRSGFTSSVGVPVALQAGVRVLLVKFLFVQKGTCVVLDRIQCEDLM